jgi:hypothetical protein
MSAYGDSQRIAAELEALFVAARDAPDELQASLGRYACVLASSYLEAALRELVVAYSFGRADPRVARFVESTLGQFRDPNMEKILVLLGRFDPVYRDRLEAATEGRLKDSVDSISANRNNIAHGRRSGISLGQVRSYYDDAVAVVYKARGIAGL